MSVILTVFARNRLGRKDDVKNARISFPSGICDRPAALIGCRAFNME